MASRVLILTKEGDATGEHVARLLAGRGSDPIMFDPGQFPAQASLTVRLSSGGEANRMLITGEDTIELDTLTSVWFRRPSDPKPHAEIAESVTKTCIQQECSAFAADLWDSLECPAVPARNAITRYAARKVFQLIVAGRLGFELPPTLITSDPEELLDFYRSYDGKIITKVIAQLGAYHGDADLSRFTELVSTRDIGYADAMRFCPVIVQPYIAKAVELRVTVVGSRVFAAEIQSQESNRAHLDWRRYDMRMTPHRVHRLARATEAHCLSLIEQLGLCYGAIDLILTPDGRYVFLEVNPSGQYLWIEEATGLPISDALCDLLLGHDQGPERPSPPTGDR